MQTTNRSASTSIESCTMVAKKIEVKCINLIEISNEKKQNTNEEKYSYSDVGNFRRNDSSLVTLFN